MPATQVATSNSSPWKAGRRYSMKCERMTQVTLGANYNLSKRTKVYGFWTKTNADDNAPYSDISSFALGVRHNF